MTSNSVDGTGSTAAYQLQDPAPAMTGQAAELHPGSYSGPHETESSVLFFFPHIYVFPAMEGLVGF